MAKLSLYIILSVLLTIATITLPSTTAETPTTTNTPLEKQSPIYDLLCPFRFNYTGCWMSIARVDNCAAELIRSVQCFNVSGVSKRCCGAVSGVGSNCFSVFGGLFAPVLKGYCDGILLHAKESFA